MCHGKEMPTDYESKRNGPDYIYDSYFQGYIYNQQQIRKLDWFRQQNHDYLVFFYKAYFTVIQMIRDPNCKPPWLYLSMSFVCHCPGIFKYHLQYVFTANSEMKKTHLLICFLPPFNLSFEAFITAGTDKILISNIQKFG